MAIYNGQKGFWVKRIMDTNPIFVSVGNDNATEADIEKAKAEWANRNNYGEGNQNNVQWVGEDPNKIYTDMATGGVTPFTPATANAVEDTYFDIMLKQVQSGAQMQRQQAQEQNQLFIENLKKERTLFNEDLERDYGRTLEKANVDVYSRGVGESGIVLPAETSAFDYYDCLERERRYAELLPDCAASYAFLRTLAPNACTVLMG